MDQKVVGVGVVFFGVVAVAAVVAAVTSPQLRGVVQL